MEKLPNRNTPKPGTAKDEKISPKKTRRSRRKQRKQSEEHQKYLVPDSIAHLTSMKSRSVNGYVQPNFIPSPTTSASIVPVPLMSINTSTAVIQNMHPLPSTSNKNKPTSREETKIVNKKEKKEKNGPSKEKPSKRLEPLYSRLPAFFNKKRTKNNIWKPPAEHETSKDKTLVNSKLSETEDLLPTIFHFDIILLQNASKGFFIKKRCPSRKYVNLNSFGPKIPVIFISNFTIRNSDNTIVISNMRNNCCISSSDSSEVTLNKCVNKSMERLEKPDAELVKEEQIESLSEKLENMNVNDQAMSNSKNIDSSQRKVPDGGKRSRSRKKKAKEAKITEGVATGSNETQIQKKRVRYRLRTPKKKVDSKGYPDYITEEEVTQGLLDGSLVKGIIRINQRNSRDAYVSSMIKGDTDYCIKSILDQNRALEGDEVILRIKSEAEWDEGRKTAVVVYISKMIHSRTSVGKLYPITRNDNFAAFFPRDKRFPVVHIPSISWPKTFKSDPQKSSKNLFVAKITEWTNIEHAKGLIIENIGISGDLKVENLAILKGCGLDHESFGNEVLKYLPKMDNLQADWLEGREDLRTECIFSIDPLTARDLDDAVSCKTLPDGNLEIGVHIADVSHFLEEGTELDKQVGWKATTIYMVDHVYHMLPVELCMGCSLLPAKDKLSFSVFWTMTPDGEILTTRFAKTIMNSCVQLAYEHAQAIIDDPDNFDASSFPKITNGYSIADVKDVVLKLYNISKILRRRRFENGALRIDQIKLSFNLDPETGLPIDYFTHELKEANWLIEEFMLLANISVAEKIMDSFPDISFLRLHEAPKESMMKELKAGLESVGIHVDTSSAMSIQSSLKKYSSDDFLGKIRGAVLNHLFAKPMVRARYFCPGIEKAATSYGHFALNIPLYTHFTSPIRRYADIMVHRLLTASLGLSKKPMWDPAFVGDVAQRCNILKYNAKKAQEESTKLYLGLFITKRGPFIRNAAVVDVKERTFDALVLDSGEIVRIYTNEIEGARFKLEEIPCLDLNTSKNASGYQKKNWQMRLSYPPLKNLPGTEVVIELFSLVQVELTMCPKKRRILAKLLRPIS